jgi:hypothetical protein
VTRDHDRFLETAVLVQDGDFVLFENVATHGLSAAAIMISLTTWVASRNDGTWPAILIGLAAVRVSYFAFVCLCQAIATERMLRRAGTPAGRLTITASCGDDGQRSWAWADVERVRACRTSVPHLRMYKRWTGLRRRVVRCRSAAYGVALDELIAAVEPFVPVADPDRPPRTRAQRWRQYDVLLQPLAADRQAPPQPAQLLAGTADGNACRHGA